MTTKAIAKKLQAECNRFNKRFPVGAQVVAWTGMMGDGPGKPATVRAPAYVLGGHTAVAYLDDISGCVAVSHIASPLRPAASAEG